MVSGERSWQTELNSTKIENVRLMAAILDWKIAAKMGKITFCKNHFSMKTWCYIVTLSISFCSSKDILGRNREFFKVHKHLLFNFGLFRPERFFPKNVVLFLHVNQDMTPLHTKNDQKLSVIPLEILCWSFWYKILGYTPRNG